jgi:hypothetical protein
MLFAVMILLALAGVAYVSQALEPSGVKMANAAEKLLAGLTPEQKAKAALTFDDKERLNWHFVPLEDGKKNPARKGLRLEEMTAEQQEAAKGLLKAGTSSEGYVKATTIMTLESILNELEKGRGPVRNPGWYFFTIFGSPSKTSKWGWRVEGHHLSLNFLVDGGKVVAATPAFFGANPAVLMQGPHKGDRTLPEAEDFARELAGALEPEQRKVAHQEKQLPEIDGRTSAPKVGEPTGLPGAKMSGKQRAVLMKLLQAYANRMPADIAQAEIAEVEKEGLDRVYFAYAGELEPGKAHTYRVQGPTFVVQFLNVQADSARNPANHIHSVWRNTKGDFGLAN